METKRYSRADDSRRRDTCEHGHALCSFRYMGPCSAGGPSLLNGIVRVDGLTAEGLARGWLYGIAYGLALGAALIAFAFLRTSLAWADTGPSVPAAELAQADPVPLFMPGVLLRADRAWQGSSEPMGEFCEQTTRDFVNSWTHSGAVDFALMTRALRECGAGFAEYPGPDVPVCALTLEQWLNGSADLDTHETLDAFAHVGRECDGVEPGPTQNAPTPGPTQSAPTPPPLGRKVNVNTDPVDVLDTLPGIGPVKAQRIVDERANGHFARAEDLERVSGIGPATAARLAPLVCFRGDLADC